MNEETIQSEIAYRLIPECNRILEVGCSYGYFTSKLKEKARDVHGVDINKKAIADAREKYKEIKFIVGRAEKLPYKKEFFDVATMLETLEHTESDIKAVREIRRVLKPRGLLILSVPNKGMFSFLDPFNLKIKFKNFLPERLLKSNQYQKGLLYHKHYSLDEINKLFQERFKIVNLCYRGLLFYPLLAIIESLASKLKIAYLSRLFKSLKNFDGGIDYGKISYNLIIKAIKK